MGIVQHHILFFIIFYIYIYHIEVKKHHQITHKKIKQSRKWHVNGRAGSILQGTPKSRSNWSPGDFDALGFKAQHTELVAHPSQEREAQQTKPGEDVAKQWVFTWGFPARHGGSPIAGWCIYVHFMDNSTKKWMMTGGTSISGKLHMGREGFLRGTRWFWLGDTCNRKSNDFCREGHWFYYLTN